MRALKRLASLSLVFVFVSCLGYAVMVGGCSEDGEKAQVDSRAANEYDLARYREAGADATSSTIDKGSVVPRDTGTTSDSSGPPESFATHAGTYEGHGFAVSGIGADYVDKGERYQVTIAASGAVEVANTKKGKLSFLWDGKNDSVKPGSTTTITIRESDGSGERQCTLIIPSTGLYNLRVDFFGASGRDGGAGDAGAPADMFMLSGFKRL